MQARTPSSTNVIIACCFASNSFRHFTKIKTKKLTKQNEKSGGKRTKRKKKKRKKKEEGLTTVRQQGAYHKKYRRSSVPPSWRQRLIAS